MGHGFLEVKQLWIVEVVRSEWSSPPVSCWVCDPEREQRLDWRSKQTRVAAAHTRTAWERGRGEVPRNKEGPEREAGGNKTRERVTLQVGEGRKLRSAWVWRQACGIFGTAQNQNRARNVGRASGKGECKEKGSVTSRPWIPAAPYGGACPPCVMRGGGVRVTCLR